VRRFFLIDAVKAVGCLLIVLHHMAFYGPMSDVVAKAWPTVLWALEEHGRLAVQFFLVCAGFLTASALSRFEVLSPREALQLVGHRYLRLAIPLLAALSFTVLATEWVRPDFDHASLSDTPEWGQALAHMVLAQQLLDMDSLSAGVWYVAIDFQLYAMTLFSLVVVKACRAVQVVPSAWALRWSLWLGLTCTSLWCWNLNPEWDSHGIYFFGSYGLGLLAWEGRRRLRLDSPNALHQRVAIWLLFVLIAGLAWALEPRSRIVTACLVAGLLMGSPAAWLTQPLHETHPPALWRRAVQGLSAVSYSVFLTHFGVSLLVSASVVSLWPDLFWAHALGMLVALLLSVGVGALLYRWVERHAANWWRWWIWAGVFKASVALALFMNAASK
jgi:peptidoglycan/LPS O-acetylase OafA/YrhL